MSSIVTLPFVSPTVNFSTPPEEEELLELLELDDELLLELEEDELLLDDDDDDDDDDELLDELDEELELLELEDELELEEGVGVPPQAARAPARVEIAISRDSELKLNRSILPINDTSVLIDVGC